MPDIVVVSIHNRRDDSHRELPIGDFHAVWKDGLSIGRDPRCSVVLSAAEVAPVAARVAAASNHKMLLRLPPGTGLPLPPVRSFSGWERIDDREFQIGPFSLRIREQPATQAVLGQPSPGVPVGHCGGCFEPHTLAGPCARCGHHDAAPISPRVLRPGTLLHRDQFVVGRVLGVPGGFGITYLAWDRTFTIRVAVKEFFPRGLASRDPGGPNLLVEPDEQAVFQQGLRQFLDEARRVAQFQDQPHVVRVRHFFEQHQTGYLVMDYYEGQTLAQYATGADGSPRRLGEREAIELMLPILDGLQDIHEQNLLHRDIKPDNIYLARRKKAIVPLLLDFGAARELVSARSKSSILTSGFAPWEQYIKRGPQGPWTDIYACAATLYTLTTATAPPDGLERKEEQDELVPPERLAPGLSRTFCGALNAALAVDPKARPQTAAAFAAALRAALTAKAPAPQSALKWSALEPRTTLGHAGEYTIFAPIQSFARPDAVRYVAGRASASGPLLRVVLEVFNPEGAADPLWLPALERRFEQVRSLGHENVAPLHELCADHGLHYAVRAFVEGPSLRERLKSGPLTIERALDTATQLARALDAGHRADLLQGELDADDVLLIGHDERVKLSWSLTVPSTAWDRRVGPPPLYPPEVIAGKPHDIRGDLFYLGVLLYRALAGRAPFEGGGHERLAAALQATPTPLTSLNPEVPAALERLIDRLLQKDPSQRFQTAGEVVTALTALAAPGVGAPRNPAAGVPPGITIAPGHIAVVKAAAQDGSFEPFSERIQQFLEQERGIADAVARASFTSPAPNLDTRIVVDLSNLRDDGTNRLSQELVRSLLHVNKAGGEMRVVCSNPRLLNLFKVTRLASAFKTFGTLDEAIAGFARERPTPARANDRHGNDAGLLAQIDQDLSRGWEQELVAARLLIDKERYAEAARQLEAIAVERAKTSGDAANRFLPLTYSLLGHAWSRMGAYETAIGWTNRALDVCQRLGDAKAVARHRETIARMSEAFVWLAVPEDQGLGALWDDAAGVRFCEIKRSRCIVGSKDADILVLHPAVDPHHFELMRDQQDRITIKSLGAYTSVNHVQVGTTPLAVPPGAEIRAGAARMYLTSRTRPEARTA